MKSQQIYMIQSSIFGVIFVSFLYLKISFSLSFYAYCLFMSVITTLFSRFSMKRYWLLLCGLLIVSVIVFFPDVSFAQDLWAADEVGGNKTLQDTMVLLQWILKVLYIILWPLLVVAGKTLDNSVVYASFLWMDAPLFMFRNIMKNFANFWLGFIVLYNIMKFLLGMNDQGKVKEIIINTLIAWVLIQSSWFVVGALVDVSTILTYSLGGMPMTLLDQTPLGDKPVLWVNSTIQLSKIADKDKGKLLQSLYYTYGDLNILPCQTYKWYIIGYQPASLDESIIIDTNICAMPPNNVVDISLIAGLADDPDVGEEYGTLVSFDDEDDAALYATDAELLQELIDQFDDDATAEAGPPFDDNSDGRKSVFAGLVNSRQKDANYTKALQDGEAYLKQQNPTGTTFDSLVSDSQGFVWPLVTLYASILDFANIDVTQSGSETVTISRYFLEFFLKFIVGVVLIVPLLLLAIVLLFRIGFMRLIIAFAPILVLLIVFKFKPTDDSSGLGEKLLGVDRIMGIIFAPVMPVFALSMSLIFLQVTNTALNTESSAETWNAFGITVRESTIDSSRQCVDFFGLTSYCYEKSANEVWWSIFVDFFSWFLLNMLALWLVWFILIAALNSSKFAWWTVKQISKTASNLAWSIPFVPIPGWWMAWANSLLGNGRQPWILGTTLNSVDRYSQRLTDESSKQISDLINPSDDKDAIAPVIAATGANGSLLAKQIEKVKPDKGQKLSADEFFRKALEATDDTQRKKLNITNEQIASASVSNNAALLKEIGEDLNVDAFTSTNGNEAVLDAFMTQFDTTLTEQQGADAGSAAERIKTIEWLLNTNLWEAYLKDKATRNEEVTIKLDDKNYVIAGDKEDEYKLEEKPKK